MRKMIITKRIIRVSGNQRVSSVRFAKKTADESFDRERAGLLEKTSKGERESVNDKSEIKRFPVFYYHI